MGTERYLTVDTVPRTADAIEAAREEGYAVVGVELADAARPMHEVDLGNAVCLVVGHEDRGLAASTIAACDVVAYLPLAGRVGSLERRDCHRSRALRSTTTGMDTHMSDIDVRAIRDEGSATISVASASRSTSTPR